MALRTSAARYRVSNSKSDFTKSQIRHCMSCIHIATLRGRRRGLSNFATDTHHAGVDVTDELAECFRVRVRHSHRRRVSGCADPFGGREVLAPAGISFLKQTRLSRGIALRHRLLSLYSSLETNKSAFPPPRRHRRHHCFSHGALLVTKGLN